MLCTIKRPISYKEIAEVAGCTRRTAIRTVKKLSLAGVVIPWSTTHMDHKQKKDGTWTGRIAGKNTYIRGMAFNEKEHLITGWEIKTDTVVGTHSWKSKWAPRIKKAFQYKTYEIKLNYTHDASKSIHKLRAKDIEEYQNVTTKKNPSSFSFCNIAKDQAHTSSSAVLEQEKLRILEKAKLTEVLEAKSCPSWWFRDIPKLTKALTLLRQKLNKNFKPNNIYKFITSLVKSETPCGYRKRQAKNTLREISSFKRSKTEKAEREASNTPPPAPATGSRADLEAKLKLAKSAYQQEPCDKTHEAIFNLKQKLKFMPASDGEGDTRNNSSGSFDPSVAAFLEKNHGLELSEKDIMQYTRKGLKTFRQALEVTKIRLQLKSRPLENISAFLNYLVGTSDPYSFLKPRQQKAAA